MRPRISTLALFIAGLVATGSCSATSPVPMMPFADFPKEPVTAGGVQLDAARGWAKAFSVGTQHPGGGPCLSEPTFNAYYPKNFTPPLFEWIPGAGQNIFELRLHIDNQANDLIVYTDQANYTLPDALWSGLTTNSVDRDIVVTIRGGSSAGFNGAYLGSKGSVRIAPASAEGTIVYWTTSSGSALRGFRIGDKDARTVLSPEILTSAGKPTTCVGCHASSPDGTLAFFGRTGPTTFSVDARAINGSGAAAQDSMITANALANLARTEQDLPALSPAHYSAMDAVVITVLHHADTGNRWELVWTDLHAQSGGTGVIPRMGDPNQAATPAWSHDGKVIAYASSMAVASGRLDRGDSEIWTVPYNGHNGGQAGPLPGVNDPRFNQYYPSYSPGDTLIAFNRNPRGTQMYDSPMAEIWVAPARGGTPIRLFGNNTPTCTGKTSPGLTNSWPRWSPRATVVDGRHFYWLAFSSRRRSGGNPQLYLSAVVTKDEEGAEVLEGTYPAVYITTQAPSEDNHTPAWDDFKILTN